MLGPAAHARQAREAGPALRSKVREIRAMLGESGMLSTNDSVGLATCEHSKDIAMIALATGLASRRHLDSTFKAHRGLTPHEFR